MKNRAILSSLETGLPWSPCLLFLINCSIIPVTKLLCGKSCLYIHSSLTESTPSAVPENTSHYPDASRLRTIALPPHCKPTSRGLDLQAPAETSSWDSSFCSVSIYELLTFFLLLKSVGMEKQINNNNKKSPIQHEEKRVWVN